MKYFCQVVQTLLMFFLVPTSFIKYTEQLELYVTVLSKSKLAVIYIVPSPMFLKINLVTNLYFSILHIINWWYCIWVGILWYVQNSDCLPAGWLLDIPDADSLVCILNSMAEGHMWNKSFSPPSSHSRPPWPSLSKDPKDQETSLTGGRCNAGCCIRKEKIYPLCMTVTASWSKSLCRVSK